MPDGATTSKSENDVDYYLNDPLNSKEGDTRPLPKHKKRRGRHKKGEGKQQP